jgi:pyruvate/2-oxoglutarate dehydrogenase complex dihydrolipoamide dehydrogenase (E3) component
VKVVVVGGGPAGVMAAVEAARTGAGVTLVSESAVGGRGTHASFVPSKVLLHAAEARRARGEKSLASAADLAAIRAETDALVKHRADRMRTSLSDAGVRVADGVARFSSASAVEVASAGGGKTLAFDRAIVAAGSEPRFPEGFFGEAGGPDGHHVFAPRHVRAMIDLPRSMLVIGGGATGAEHAHAFLSLGVEVTWLLDELGILPGFDRELADSLGDVLMERGVKIVHGKRVLSVVHDPKQGALAKLDGGRTYAAERAFVAVGRRADTTRLGLAELGIDVHADGTVPVDGYGRTRVESIYAVGDTTRGAQSSARAEATGWTAARHATQQKVDELRPAAFIEAVYTTPEVARVGASPRETAARGGEFDLRTHDFGGSLRATFDGVGREPHARGVVRVVSEPDGGKLLGATAIGPHAAEVLAPIAVAIGLGASARDLAHVFLPAPSYGEIATQSLR